MPEGAERTRAPLRLIIAYSVRNRNAEKPLTELQRLFFLLVSLREKTRGGRFMRHKPIKAAARVKPPAGEPPRAGPA